MGIGLQSALLAVVIGNIVVAQGGGDHYKSGYMSDVARLRRMLFRERGYEATSRPNNGSSEPTVVHVAIFFENIMHVAIQDDCFSIVVFLCAFWKDLRLTWNAQEFGNRAFIAAYAKDVWSPDLDFVNVIGEDFDSMKNMITVQPSGSVWACASVKVKSPCAVDLSRFPSDEQLCVIRVVSSAYSDSEVKLAQGTVWGSHQDNASTEWNVTGVSFLEHTALNRSFLDMSFRMRRFSKRHRHVSTVPWVASALVTLAAFWIPAHTEHRIRVADLNLLFVTLMLSRTAPLLGSSAVTPNILLFLGLAAVVQVVAAAGHLFALNFLSFTASAEVPDALRHIFSRTAATMLCLSDREPTEPAFSRPDDVLQLSAFDNPHERRRHWLLLVQVTDRLLFMLFAFMTFAFLV